MCAQVWPGPTHYPDFLHPPTGEWWARQLRRMHDQVPFDGMWVDMNEASNFCEGEVCSIPSLWQRLAGEANRRPRQLSICMTLCPLGVCSVPRRLLRTPKHLVYLACCTHLVYYLTCGSVLQLMPHVICTHSDRPGSLLRGRPLRRLGPGAANQCMLRCEQPAADNTLAHPPYAINNLNARAPLGQKTLAMTVQHHSGARQYDTHNLYGLSEARATHAALLNITGKRPFVLSRCAATARHASRLCRQ